MPHEESTGDTFGLTQRLRLLVDLYAVEHGEDLVAAVEQACGVKITIVELPEIAPEEGLFGLWLSMEEHDYILHAPTKSGLHRQQIILRELARMLLDHDLSLGENGAAALLPDLPQDTVVRTLARGHHDNAMEHEAEHLADLLDRSLRRGHGRAPFSEVFG